MVLATGRTKGIVSFAKANEIRIGPYSSQSVLACTTGPIKVSGGQTWLASSELRETKLQRKCQEKFKAYSEQLTICSGQLTVYSST